ncbi:unnamed protein product [Lupinus luteus]|uniref:Uncharacterized protein n=1 Tax=Lupinus luteus TaxID=3873 RepID=A0AAV1VQX3_LUPLU
MPAYESEHEPEPEPQPQPHPPHFSSPHFQGEQPYGGFTTFPPNYHMGQSSQFQESLPSMFATSSHTPTSAYRSQDYYRPVMPSQAGPSNIYGNEGNDDDGGEGNEEEEQQLRRVHPPRRRRSPPCGTSSHHQRH